MLWSFIYDGQTLVEGLDDESKQMLAERILNQLSSGQPAWAALDEFARAGIEATFLIGPGIGILFKRIA